MRLVKTNRVSEPRQTLEPGCHSTCPLARMLSSLPAKAPHASRGARSLLSRKVGSFVARADTRRLDVIGVHQKVGGLFWKLLQNQEDPPKTFDSKPARSSAK